MPIFQALKALAPKRSSLSLRKWTPMSSLRAIRALMEDSRRPATPLCTGTRPFLGHDRHDQAARAPPAVMLARLVRRMKQELGLTASIGCRHHTKFLARSPLSKISHTGFFPVIGQGETQTFLTRQTG